MITYMITYIYIYFKEIKSCFSLSRWVYHWYLQVQLGMEILRSKEVLGWEGDLPHGPLSRQDVGADRKFRWEHFQGAVVCFGLGKPYITKCVKEKGWFVGVNIPLKIFCIEIDIVFHVLPVFLEEFSWEVFCKQPLLNQCDSRFY